MTRTISLVQRVYIASPCTAPWDEMVGDDKSRFCSQCKLNVYNLSAMTEEEGERLIIEKEGKLCARIYQRSDGTVLTKDCPVGLRAIKRRLVWMGMRTAAAILFITAATVSAIAGGRSRNDGGGFVFNGSEYVFRTPPTFDRVCRSMSRWLSTNTPLIAVTMGVMRPMPTQTTNQLQPQVNDESADIEKVKDVTDDSR